MSRRLLLYQLGQQFLFILLIPCFALLLHVFSRHSIFIVFVLAISIIGWMTLVYVFAMAFKLTHITMALPVGLAQIKLVVSNLRDPLDIKQCINCLLLQERKHEVIEVCIPRTKI